MNTTLKLTLSALATAPAVALAHHGPERDVAGQVAHVATDPFHVAITLLLGAGVVALLAAAYRRRDRS